jgi:prophage regulatory protein
VTTSQNPRWTFSRRSPATARFGISRSTWYAHIADGLLPPPVRVSARAVGWIDHELDAVAAARAANRSDEEIRDLVRTLVAARSRKSA